MDLDKYGPKPAQSYDYVVCSNCGAEYQPHVTRCIDCGAATVPPGARQRAPRQTLSPDAEVASLRNDEDLEWIEALQKRLSTHGIPSRIETVEGSPSDHPTYEILVAEKDARRAFELDQRMLRERLGGEAEGPVEEVEEEDEDDEDDEDDEEEDFAGLSNLEVVQSLYNALKDGDEELVLGILHPEVEWVQNVGFPGGGSYIGAETVMNEVFLRLAEEWEGWGAAVGRWLNAGDSVVALGAYHGTCRRTGKSMQAAFAHVYWLEKGRIVRFEQYADTAKVAEACGG